MDRNFQNVNENNEVKGKAGGFWKSVGFAVIAIALAVVTVFVLNLNIRA